MLRSTTATLPHDIDMIKSLIDPSVTKMHPATPLVMMALALHMHECFDLPQLHYLMTLTSYALSYSMLIFNAGWKKAGTDLLFTSRELAAFVDAMVTRPLMRREYSESVYSTIEGATSISRINSGEKETVTLAPDMYFTAITMENVLEFVFSYGVSQAASTRNATVTQSLVKLMSKFTSTYGQQSKSSKAAANEQAFRSALQVLARTILQY